MAHVTDLGFTWEELLAHINAGLVRRQLHPSKPLEIYNYTEEVQFSKRWDKITMACRGLILDEQHNIVARPWKKFFNFGERDLEIDFNAPVEVTDKMDGSLGILYHDGDDWAIATRGSFASDQALHATKVLHQNYRQDLPNFDVNTSMTFLFEIIYPDNRIVVNYGLMDDLVMLGAVDNKYGSYFGPLTAQAISCWNGPVTETFDYPTFGTAISAVDREGKEGIVIRSGSKMVKLKQADYVELHRIVTNLSPRTVWAQMRDGKTEADICAHIPDEFHAYVKDIGRDLTAKASDIIMGANIEFSDISMRLLLDGVDFESPGYRREFAQYASKSKFKAYLFMLLDKKPILDTAWLEVKPRGDAKLVSEDA